MIAPNLKMIWDEFILTKENSESSNRAYDEFVKHHSEPIRTYHNLHHIDDLLQQIKAFDVSGSDEKTLVYTAFFHDVIYAPGRSDNEKNSAIYAEEVLLKLGVEEAIIQKVSAMIVATYSHDSDDPLTQLFLDMDMSILGSSPERYQKYTEQIRAENKKFPNWMYRKGRKKFLKATLQKEQIFLTNEYLVKHEKSARENMVSELKILG